MARLPDLRSLRLSVTGTASEDNTLKGVDHPTEDLSPGSPSKQARGIVVRRVTILPRPEGALKPFDAWSLTLNSLREVLLTPYAEGFSVAFLEAQMHNQLRLPSDRELSYNEALTFLGHYMAWSIVAINVSGPPNALWGGPIAMVKNYPVGRCGEIHAELIRMERVEIVREVLARVCPGSPPHPFHPQNGRRNSTHPYIDNMGSIVEMIIADPDPKEDHPGYDRELLIATTRDVTTRDVTTRGAFVGHMFVSYAREPIFLESRAPTKGIMPYGISRSAFFLPGTCAPPRSTNGFVHALFETINEIMQEKGITHAFTWPLAKMKERFVAMKWLVIPKGQVLNPHYETLQDVVGSIYGKGSKIFKFILNSQFNTWDFVMRVVA